MERSFKLPGILSLLILAVGCAHSQKKSPAEFTAADGAASSNSPATPAFSPEKRMPLPYTFFRRGVKIRANSVEFSEDKLLVSVTLEETKGETGLIRPATLMEAHLAGSEAVLPYTGYRRDGLLQKESELTLTANQKFTVDLVFQLSTEAKGTRTPIELQFTTGKWWSSQ